MTAAAPETPATPVYRPDQLLGARHDTPDMTGALVGFEPFGESVPETPAAVDVNDLPVTPAAVALYKLCSAWTRQAFRIPFMLGEKDPRAIALDDCSDRLRETVNDLRRDGEL